MSLNKTKQLGMPFSKANYTLYRDIMYHLAIKSGLDLCVHCNKPLSRDTFSVEHKISWQNSDNPVELFFSMDNIAFSHLSCNISVARKATRVYSDKERQERRNIFQRKWRQENKEKYSKRRADKYKRLGT
jgi:hypothetical protein